MNLYGESEHTYNAVVCQKPKMSSRSGRTWDSLSKSIDEVQRDFHFDSTLGKNLYFVYDGTWFKVNLSDGDPYKERCFYTRKDKYIDEAKQKEDRTNLSFHETLKEWNWLAIYLETRNLPTDEMWEKVTSFKTERIINRKPILDTFEEFKSIVKSPSKAQKKIIAMNNGVFRQKDLFNEKTV